MMKLDYAIFDLDGTLVDSMVYWKNLGLDFLASKALTQPEGWEQAVAAMTIAESATWFRRELGLEESREALAAQMNGMLERRYRWDISLFPGVATYLRQCTARGVRLCVASATDAHLVNLCLSRLGVLDLFDFVLCCQEVGAGKHSPDIYLEAARRWGKEPWDIAVYEDAAYAAKTAKEAGFYVIGVGDDRELESWSDVIITDWRQGL